MATLLALIGLFSFLIILAIRALRGGIQGRSRLVLAVRVCGVSDCTDVRRTITFPSVFSPSCTPVILRRGGGTIPVLVVGGPVTVCGAAALAGRGFIACTSTVPLAVPCVLIGRLLCLTLSGTSQGTYSHTGMAITAATTASYGDAFAARRAGVIVAVIRIEDSKNKETPRSNGGVTTFTFIGGVFRPT